MTTKIIDKKIGTFISNTGKLKALGHEIALLIFDHAMAHQDCTRAIKLTAALPNSWQPQMEAWFKAFSPIRVVLKNDKCELAPEYKKATPENKAGFWDRASALSTPFYEVMEEPKVDKEYDFAAILKMIERLPVMIEKKIADGKVKAEDVESAKAVAIRVAGLKFERVSSAEMIAVPSNEGEASLTPPLTLAA